MTIKEFIDKYNTFTSTGLTAKCVKDVLKRTYCPVAEKYTIIKTMFDKSVIEQQNGLRYIDQWVFRMNMTMAIVAMYTNLEADSENNDIFTNYDLLVENNINGLIRELIGENECKEIDMICNDIQNVFEQENSMRNYTISMIEKYVTLFAAIIGKESDKIADIISDNEQSKELLLKIDEVLKTK